MTRSLIALTLAAGCILAAGPAFAGATDDVRASIVKFASLQSFEMVSQQEGKTATIDVINRPAAVHMSSPGGEMITVGGTAYMRAGGSWRKYPSSPRAMPLSDPIRHMADQANALTANDLGMKSVGGEMLHAYKITQKDGESGIVYIGGDGLPHRYESSDHSVVRMLKFNGIASIRAPM